MSRSIRNSNGDVTQHGKFASVEQVTAWLLASPLGSEIQEMMLSIEVDDLWLDGIVLDATRPGGGDAAQQELPNTSYYLVLAIRKRETDYPAGINLVDLGGEAGR